MKLRVSPEENRRIARGMTEEEQGDTPEQVERCIAESDAISPLVLTSEEELDMLAWREKTRQFNLEAVRRQMEEGFIP